jgi:hypothetical protein
MRQNRTAEDDAHQGRGIYSAGRCDMRPIAIVPRPGRAMGVEMHGAVACLRNAGISSYNAVNGRACALVWVDDENVSMSVETLTVAGFLAAALTHTDLPH